MPIKGLTTDVKPHFPSLGILRKGALVDTGKVNQAGNPIMRPVDLNVFRFVSAERADIEATFRTAYGDEPNAIPFYFQYDSIDDVWDNWQEEWVAGGLVHRCDSETMVLSRHNGGYTTERKPCPYHAGQKQRTAKEPGCKPVGRLRIILPALLEAGFIGDVTFLTGSKHDLMSIQSCLNIIAELRKGQGLRGIEFILRRDMKVISTPGPDGKRLRREKSLVTITPSQRFVQFQLAAAEKQVYLLEAGDDSDVDDEPDLDYGEAVIPAGASIPAEPVTDGEYIEEEDAAPEEEPEQKQVAGNGKTKWADRPWSPDYLRAALGAQVDKKYSGFKGKAPSGNDKKQIGLLAGKMAEVLGGKEYGTQGRHVALEYLFGVTSTNGLDLAQVKAGLDWLVGPQDDGGHYTTKPHAAQELQSVVREALRAKGQLQTPETESDNPFAMPDWMGASNVDLETVDAEQVALAM